SGIAMARTPIPHHKLAASLHELRTSISRPASSPRRPGADLLQCPKRRSGIANEETIHLPNRQETPAETPILSRSGPSSESPAHRLCTDPYQQPARNDR